MSKIREQYQQQVAQYQQLLSQGVPSQQAFQQAFPNGIPTQQDYAKEQAKEQQKTGIGAIGGTLAGALGTSYLVNKVPEWLAPAAAEAATTAATAAAPALGIGPVASGAEYGAMLGSEALTAAAPEVAGAAAAEGVGAVGPGIGAYAGPLVAALGAYQLKEAIDSGSKTQGAIGGAGLAGGLAMAAPLLGLGPLGWGALGLTALGGGALGAGLTGVLDRETTKEIQEKEWNKLADGGDPVTAAYAKQYLDHIRTSGVPGEGESFREKKASGRLGAEDVWGGKGMFDTFGSDWLNKFSEQQRRDISQQLLEQDLIDQVKGDIVIKNQDAARRMAYGNQPQMGYPLAEPAPQPGQQINIPSMAGNHSITPGGKTSINGGLSNMHSLTQLLPDADLSQIQDGLGRYGSGQQSTDNKMMQLPGLPDWFTQELMQQNPTAYNPQAGQQLTQAMQRSKTRSPGIDMQGNRIRY